MKKITHYLLLVLFLLFAKTGISQEEGYAFNNSELSIGERVEDLISRLTLEEKVGQLMYSAPAIERLGIPQYNWWNECLHGLSRNGRATVFTQAIGLATTFDKV